MKIRIQAHTISGSTSLVLDSFRIVASFTVLIYHAYDQWFPSGSNTTGVLSNAAHTAVVVFFVLSGYLIAHTSTRTKNLTLYAEARLSRLCSVVIPALLITLIAQLIVVKLDPNLSNTYLRGASLPRYLMSAGFLNEIWFFSSAPPMNSPLWSLSYEFWYYAIFGLWLYLSKGWKAYFLVFCACLIAGPKILLMMPIWLIGSVAYKTQKPALNKVLCYTFIFLALSTLIIAIMYLPGFPYVIGSPPLFFSNQFITDYILGILIAVVLWLLPLGGDIKGKSLYIRRYRLLADLTFPLYVLHYPLLILLRALFRYRIYDALQMWEELLLVLLISFILGYIMESKRWIWLNFFKWLFNLIKK